MDEAILEIILNEMLLELFWTETIKQAEELNEETVQIEPINNKLFAIFLKILLPFYELNSINRFFYQ